MKKMIAIAQPKRSIIESWLKKALSMTLPNINSTQEKKFLIMINNLEFS